MTKKRLGNDPLASNPLDWIAPSTDANPPVSKKIKSTQQGLKENWTRATFIVNEAVLEKLKDIAYIERKKIKEVVNEAFVSRLKEPINSEETRKKTKQ